MRVNELAKELGVTGDTIRFYTRIGFLKPEKNPGNGYKAYGSRDKRTLQFILSARQLGFTVDDIGQLLDTANHGHSPCPLARQLIQQRLAENEQRFHDSLRLRQRMLAAIGEWDDMPDRKPTGDMICHLIEEFDESAPHKHKARAKRRNRHG